MTIKLDQKDKKILFELEQDSRQSYAKIAKQVGLKRETVFHRIKNLESKGIIRNYITEINVYKLGYMFYSLKIKLENTSPVIEKEMYSDLKKSPYTVFATNCEGHWDLLLILISKKSIDLQKFLEKFSSNYRKYINDKEFSVITEIHYFKKAFWMPETTMEITTTGGDNLVEVDHIDLSLLKLLSTNARIPLIEIGEKLNLHPKTIAHRIKSLYKKNIIIGSRIRVNFSKMGFRFYKIFIRLNDPSKENLRKIMTYLHIHPSVIWMTKTLGKWDLSLEIAIEHVGDYRKFLDDFKIKFSTIIKCHESLAIFQESVMDYLPIK